MVRHLLYGDRADELICQWRYLFLWFLIICKLLLVLFPVLSRCAGHDEVVRRRRFGDSRIVLVASQLREKRDSKGEVMLNAAKEDN